MKRLSALTLLILSVILHVSGQMTSYHDPGVMNQFLITEGGGGSFNPQFYYQMTHSSYRGTALGTGKLVFRNEMYQTVYKEIEYSQVIDSVLAERLKIESLNVAERQTKAGDLAWVAEGPSVTSSLSEFANQINKIMVYGGKKEDKEHYELQLNVIKCGLEAVRESYMPMSNRKLEYQNINQDIKSKTNQLNNFLFDLKCRQLANIMKERKKMQKKEAASIIDGAHGRWLMALKGRTSGSEGGSNQGSSNGIEE